MFSFFKRKSSVMELEIKFHKEANLFGEHGSIVVSHVKQRLAGVAVKFVFVGVSTPPKLTPFLLTYIWEEAKSQGYVPHHIETYGRENDLVNTEDTSIESAIVVPFISRIGCVR